MAEFLNFCPVIGMEGSRMHKFDVDTMLRQLKKVYIERVVANGFEDGYLYNDELLKLGEVEIDEFKELKGIIGSTKAMPRTKSVDINNQGLTNEEYSELEDLEKRSRSKKDKAEMSEEQKRRLEELRKRRKNRENAISILRGISIRMPLMIYGADIEDTKEDITIDNFTSLIDPLSWDEFMPRGVSKQKFNAFRKYYDPDIFAAAAKRIREMARNADRLSIEQRIERITQIFATFRNPDKETVLTPWRVVNMHISDTIGGYCFLDEDFKEPISEPRFVDRGKVTSEVFNPDTHILEINSKTGLYPLFMAYSTYRSRLANLLTSPESVEDEWAVWRSVVAENIFVICKTPMAKQITKRTLVGFRSLKVNTRYFEDLINQIKNKPSNFIEKVAKGKSFWKAVNNDNMKFNAIVGNPPYQVMDGGAGVSAKPVYNLFVDIAKVIKPSYISMIMPAKWFTDGKGLGSFRTSMFADRRLSHIFDFVDSRDCFSNVDIAGGVCYFLWNSYADGNCQFTTLHRGERTISTRDLSDMDEFIRHSEAVNIVDSVKAKSNKFFDEIVSTQKPFGLRTYITPLTTGDLTLKYNKGKGPYKSEMIEVGKSMIPQWKVIISCLTAEHAGQTDKEGRKKILSSLDMLIPKEICTETYMVVGSFDTEEEAINLTSYLRTRFTRFLIAQLAATQHLSKEKFALVPNQDFTSNSDIDWSKSVEEIDAQLYAKYDLSAEEVVFIESMIKPM